MLLKACWVPGLPHLLTPEKSPAWSDLNRACLQLADEIDKCDPDVLVVYSTQWISVLGTSFQLHPNPKGLHVDENWHDLPDLSFDLKIDSDLSALMAKRVEKRGLAARTVAFDGFPIDTATIVMSRLLNKKNRALILVSSGVYCGARESAVIGEEMRLCLEDQGKKGVFVACSLLSARFFTHDIDPAKDMIRQGTDDQWNRKVLAAFEEGDLESVSRMAPQFTSEALADMQFNAFHWLRGALAGTKVSGRVLGYGPIWGTGAAVVGFA